MNILAILPGLTALVSVVVFLIRLEGKNKVQDTMIDNLKNDLNRLGEKVEKSKDNFEKKFDEMMAQIQNISVTVAKIEAALK